jgi:hypothetical protein
VVQADAFDYLPPEPVDVVICEMLHVGLLREKQLAVIAAFKERCARRFPGPLPIFVPEATLQAVQPVEQSFTFEGYYVPTMLFQDPVVGHSDTRQLGGPVIYQQLTYERHFSLSCRWSGELSITTGGKLNTPRIVTKTSLPSCPRPARSSIGNQYLMGRLKRNTRSDPEITFECPLTIPPAIRSPVFDPSCPSSAAHYPRAFLGRQPSNGRRLHARAGTTGPMNAGEDRCDGKILDARGNWLWPGTPVCV